MSTQAPEHTSIPLNPSDAHVLVVEDNVPDFVAVARLLASMGVQHCEWKTSNWQLTQFANRAPRIDLILLNLRLPFEDGYRTLEKIRDDDRLKDILVIAMTSPVDVRQAERARDAGFDAILSKPLDEGQFSDTVRRLLAGDEVWDS